MTLHVNSGLSLNELQQQFQQEFPQLKLEFFFNGTEGLNLSASLERSFPHARIRDLCNRCLHKNLELTENMTIHELEMALNKEFGLPARVYVRKDGYWLKSKTYDHIPLKQIGGNKQSVRIAG